MGVNSIVTQRIKQFYKSTVSNLVQKFYLLSVYGLRVKKGTIRKFDFQMYMQVYQRLQIGKEESRLMLINVQIGEHAKKFVKNYSLQMKTFSTYIFVPNSRKLKGFNDIFMKLLHNGRSWNAYTSKRKLILTWKAILFVVKQNNYMAHMINTYSIFWRTCFRIHRYIAASFLYSSLCIF
jgi:hypothetical protein